MFDTELLGRIIKEDKDQILLNLNHPSTYPDAASWDTVVRNMDEMAARKIRFQIGYNMYEREPDYNFFIDAIKKYGMKTVRWDLARPAADFSNRHFTMKEFFEMTPVLAGFLAECGEAGADVYYDCPLPVCMWMDKRLYPIARKVDLSRNCCVPDDINIGPGLTISSCPASLRFSGITLRDFSSISQACEFVRQEIDKTRWNVWNLSECDRCIYRVLRECQGGCIGHKREKDNRVAGRRELEEFLGHRTDGGAGSHNNKLHEVKTEEIAGCIDRYKEAVKSSAAGLFEWYSLGRCYEAAGCFDDAIGAYDTASGIDSANEIVKNRINFVYMLKAAKSKPANPAVWARLLEASKKTNPDSAKEVVAMHKENTGSQAVKGQGRCYVTYRNN
jgi:hypothetical protein